MSQKSPSPSFRLAHSLVAVSLLTSAIAMGPVADHRGSLTLSGTARAVKTTLRTIPLDASRDAVRSGAPTARVPEGVIRDAHPPSGLVPVVSTPELETNSFSLAAVTWRGSTPGSDLEAYIRTRSGGHWTAWFPLPNEADGHAPDPGSSEARRQRQGTAPLLSAPSDGIQVRVDTRGGVLPADMRVDLVDPGSSAAGAGTTIAPALALPSKTISMSSSPEPPIRSRAQWGADESKVKEPPEYGTVKGAFVHHTVNSNSYSESDVPALIRAIYAYHVDSRGWNDIGYNFIVDRFGRIWEGRKGGVDRAVIGAHTAGYNSQAFAMAALGTFDSVSAPDPVITAYTQLFAWKFAIHGVDPRRTTYYNTNGNNPISGHRDVNSTECPGDALYAQLPRIRSQVISRMSPFPRFDTIAPAGDATGDHNQDVVAVDRDGSLLLYPGNRSTGAFLAPRSVGGGWQTIDRVLGVGDFDGDHKDDLIGRERRTGYLWLYPGSAKDHTPYATRVRVGTGFGRFDNVVAAGDLTGDSHPDIVANDNDGRLWVFPGNGLGGFLPRFEAGRGWYSINELTGGGDYTGDAKDDLVGRTTTGDLYVYAGPGASNTPITKRIKVGANYNIFDTFIGPGNWTPDSKPDLLLRHDIRNDLRIYYGNGPDGFLNGRVIGTGW